MEIKGKRLMVIGGAGLIGSHTVDRLLREEVEQVLIYDNFTRGRTENIENALKDPRCSVYDVGGDILQTDILNAAMKDNKIDGVFHLAALWLLQCHEYPRSAFNTNIAGTFNVMEACVANDIKRLIWSSSASVYGDAITDPMEENHPYNNKNFYGATKIAGEAMMRSFHHRYGLDYIGLRYMNVYGPRQDYHGAYIAVIMKMLDAIDRGEAPTIMGDGSEAFDFIAVEDCAKANVCGMISQATDEFYNVGTGIRTSLKELAEMLLEITDSSMEIRYEERNQSTLVRNRIGCPEKAINDIKFKSKINIKSGLKSLIIWRKNHKDELENRRKKFNS